MREIEIKLRIQGLPALRRRLRRLGFKPTSPRLLERNQVFDTPQETHRNSGQLLRLRSKGGQWWLTFKNRPEIHSRHKVREEIEVEIIPGERLGDLLCRLGYHPTFRYEKYRTEFHQPGRRGKLLLDETPVGDFIELEGPPRWIDRLASELGYGVQDYIVESYSNLYFAWCRERSISPGNMVFTRSRRGASAIRSSVRRHRTGAED